MTYQQSEEARREESDTPDIYTRVYHAERPELFLKATVGRVVTEGTVIVRRDSHLGRPNRSWRRWSTPTRRWLVTPWPTTSAAGLEGENPLYVPQAKVCGDRAHWDRASPGVGGGQSVLVGDPDGH